MRRLLLLASVTGLMIGCGGKKAGDSRTQTVAGVTGRFAPTPDPPSVGLDSNFTVALSESGKPLTGMTVNFALFFRSLNQTGPTGTAFESSRGEYTITGLTTGMNGKWEAEVTASRSDRPDVKFTFPFSVSK